MFDAREVLVFGFLCLLALPALCMLARVAWVLVVLGVGILLTMGDHR